MFETGRVLFYFLLATLLAVGASLLVAKRYRAAMTRLMRSPTAAEASTVLAAAPRHANWEPPTAHTLAGNQRAFWRLVALLSGLSLLMAMTHACIAMPFVYETTLTVSRVATLSLVYAWPVVPAIGLLRRWSRWRVIAALGAWSLAALALMAWRTTEAVTVVELIRMLGMEIGIPLVVVAALCLGSATRAVAPWLLLPFLGLAWSSSAGLDLLAVLINRQSPFLSLFPAWLGVWPVFIGFSLAPWLLAWWPVKQIGRWLARAYARRAFSELTYLFAAVWGIVLFFEALSAASRLGWRGGIVLLPLLWIPVGLLVFARLRQTAAGRPPTLLVLRVFQQDAAVTALFDAVVERWRLTGNTVLIAGTDLVERTLDAEDIFTFIDGRLGERFMRSPADVAPRIAGFEFHPDAEGRYRVNECYCHDQTWKAALAELVEISDVVLMDLRNFKAKNAGCAHELGVLAGASHLRRIVVLTNRDTDRDAALAAAAGAPVEHFIWLDQGKQENISPAAVLAALFPAPPAASPGGTR